jgi:prepilin-type processing-associated H-X9-DG protein
MNLNMTGDCVSPREMTISPYTKRSIRFLEIWSSAGWRLKVYGIACQRPMPRPELVEGAKVVAGERLASVPASIDHYSVGFLGVHDGRTANFVFVDWWADEDELHHHVYVSPIEEPSRLTYATPTGLAACVWDLRLIAFERQAWLDTVLMVPHTPDLDAYLRLTLNEDV